jgi:diguanylate cyclase (GGDEF)-like protein
MWMRLSQLLRTDVNNVPLMRAQLAAFTKQVPLLYFILIVNACALAFSHRHIAPGWLTFGILTSLTCFCSVRILVWVKTKKQPLTDEAVARRLKSTVVLGALIGVAFLVWALTLFGYGNDRAQDQVTFFVGITVISCIFCLMHLRPAALLLTGIIIGPFTLFLLSTGDENLISIGINLGLVSVAMVYVLLVASRDFGKMVNSEVEARRLGEENARLANTDPLTGLPNRRQFFAELNGAIERARNTERHVAAGVLDLDGFKPVNDRFGHVTGDQVLIEASERLRAVSNRSTFIARLGGDEFGIILEGAESEQHLLSFGDRVCSTLRTPYEVAGIVANLSASIGLAAFPDAGDSAIVLYEHADYALYHAKGHARGQPVVFSAAHEFEMRNNTITEQCLRNADLEAEMSLHFQPIFDVKAKRLLAFEALARWNSPCSGGCQPRDIHTDCRTFRSG